MKLYPDGFDITSQNVIFANSFHECMYKNVKEYFWDDNGLMCVRSIQTGVKVDYLTNGKK